MGKILRGRGEGFCRDALKKLRHAGIMLAVNEENIFQHLSGILSVLDYDEREIFLDIACSLLGWVPDDVISMW